MTVPTQGEECVKLLEYLVKAQESCAMLSHLANAHGSSSRDKLLATGWMAIAENIRKMEFIITKLAMGKF